MQLKLNLYMYLLYLYYLFILSEINLKKNYYKNIVINNSIYSIKYIKLYLSIIKLNKKNRS